MQNTKFAGWTALALAALALLPGAAAGAERGEDGAGPGRMVLPPMASAPVIDGDLSDAAWKDAAQLQGFMFHHAASLDERAGHTLVGYDAENLYIAFSSEMHPDGKLIAKVRRDKDQVHRDDAVEVWIDPNRARRADGAPGDLHYYQIILNSLGKKLDTAFDGGQASSGGWTLKGHRFASGVDAEKKRWNIELAIPWESVNTEYAKVRGREIGVQVVRVLNRPYNQGEYSFAAVGPFVNWANHPAFLLKDDAPLFREESLGNPFEADLDYRLSIRNNAAGPLSLKIESNLVSTTMPTKQQQRELVVAPGRTESFSVDTPPGSYHKDSTNTLTVSAMDAGGVPLFRRALTIKKAREEVWENIGADEAAAMALSYYPSLNKLGVRLDLTLAENPKASGAAKVEVLDDGGAVLFAGSLPLDEKICEGYFDIPDLPDGRYSVRVEFAGFAGKPRTLAKEFQRIHFPWEGGALGETDEIFAPFLPVAAGADGRVEVVLRAYTMNGFGLWDGVTAKGREILAAPMRVDLETENGPAAWDAVGPARLAESRPNLARYESRAESGAVVVDAVSSIEEDGCMRVEMRLSPGKTPQTIRALSVRIPIRDDIAPFWHLMASDFIRSNPVGNAPAGQGVVWDSRKTGNGSMRGNFIPYIWLGGAERGMAWFANNDKGWSVDDEKPAQTLTRENGRLILSIHLVTRPLRLEAPRTVVFGLQASPAKPRMDGWRKLAFDLSAVHGGSSLYWGTLQSYSGKYPADRDWEIIDRMVKGRDAGKPDPAAQTYIDQWIKEKLPNYDEETVKWVRAHVNGGFAQSAGAGMHPKFIYFEGHGQDAFSEEWRIFQDEWVKEPFTSRKTPTRTGAIKDIDNYGWVCFNKSYVDFALYYGKMWMDRGYSLYSDNAFPMASFDPVVSDAYLRPDGQTQASAGIWEIREYYKRMWKLVRQRRPNTRYPLL